MELPKALGPKGFWAVEVTRPTEPIAQAAGDKLEDEEAKSDIATSVAALSIEAVTPEP